MNRTKLTLGGKFLSLLMVGLLPIAAFGQETPPPAPAPAPTEQTTPAAAPADTPAEAATAAEAPAVSAEMFAVNNTWMMVCAALVFFMGLGFACVETGLTQSKNTANILFKNAIIPCLGILLYAIAGFNLMYPGFADGDNMWFKFSGFGIQADAAGVTSAYNVGYTYWTDFLFQAMFAATAATIVSGAVAERVKLSSFLVFTILFVGFVYPLAGSWKWGNGWLNRMETPFYDFAGSTLVHSVGGWGALAGAIILGPRRGKYTADGKVRPIIGHSMPLATIGVFVLWLGWFGFNGGSVLSADPALVSLTLVTTSLSACAGGAAACFVSWIVLKKPDLSMTLNGILGGLVGITAGADQMNANNAMLIGTVAGIVVVFAVMFFDKVRVDDPVGAISVHLVCGVWGTLAVGIFGAKAGGAQLVSQLIGIAAYGIFAAACAFILFIVIKAVMGLRVSPEEEEEGLDIGEHGCVAYDIHPAK